VCASRKLVAGILVTIAVINARAEEAETAADRSRRVSNATELGDLVVIRGRRTSFDHLVQVVEPPRHSERVPLPRCASSNRGRAQPCATPGERSPSCSRQFIASDSSRLGFRRSERRVERTGLLEIHAGGLEIPCPSFSSPTEVAKNALQVLRRNRLDGRYLFRGLSVIPMSFTTPKTISLLSFEEGLSVVGLGLRRRRLPLPDIERRDVEPERFVRRNVVPPADDPSRRKKFPEPGALGRSTALVALNFSSSSAPRHASLDKP